MNRAIFVTSIVILTLTGTAFSQSNIDADHQFAWGENIGWTNWRDANGTADGVVVNGTHLSGYVWAENAGWINVGNGPANGTSYANLDGTDFGVNMAANGDLSGFAWSENDGWINFDTSTHSPDQARFDADNSRFRGWVWSENGGWINLDDDDKFVGVEIEPPVRAPSPHDILKNRYISIDPRGAMGVNPSSHHIRVMVESSQVGGQVGNGPWWAGPPNAECISMVMTTKPGAEPDWSACPTLHLTGCAIIPTSVYALAVESGGTLSADGLFETQAKPSIKWHGDCVGAFTGTEWTGPNGHVNIDDAAAAIKTFQNPSKLPGCGAPPCNATHTSVTDLAPNLPPTGPNKIVNIEDVLILIMGFQGNEYPGPDLTQCP